MFKQLTDKINYSRLELEILQFWKDNKIFEKSVSTREGKPGFTFYEGPPTANGMPGIHHVMSRTLKDLVCRYKTMRGYQVHRKAGWDTHGLPVEIEVEKSLGIKHKDEIVNYGVARFNEECRKSVWKYKAEWERMTERMGYWVDMNNPYITFTNEYIESIWWSLKQFYDKGFIYKGYRSQPYCPRCETSLSSHEVALGYDEVKDPSIFIKLRLKDEPNTFFLVWTTTPWTLPSNLALAVHKDVDYVKVRFDSEHYILAESRLSVLGEGYEIEERMKGKQLIGKEYERLFDYATVNKRAYFVEHGDFVSTEDGTGIVHIAPAFGDDDYKFGQKYDLPFVQLVDKSGNMSPETGELAGKFVKDADQEIIQNLKLRGLLFRKETITHSYPHCWRCDTPLLYYARESWYIATTKYAHRMVELNKTINWVPEEVGVGRFGNWLEENKDWSLSRDRFWGTPLPIWICETCGEQECVGSIEQLKTHIPNLPSSIDLHKPYVDELTWNCTCGGTRRRTPELIDVWFDSGAMPFAQWHYPFENKAVFESRHPADYISEGIDQTRGWFYSLHAISTFLFDKPAYKNVLVNELILDKSGQKMSKSKGNTVDPFAMIDKYGADATRWYLVTNSPPWRPTLFDEDGLVEVQRKFFSTLVNTYSFFALYANIDGFRYKESPLPLAERQEIDRWIISLLNSLVKQYEEAMDKYDVTKAARAVSDFTIDQLSNWYVRRNRRRFWSTTRLVERGEQGKDKTAAYQTLYDCLITVLKLMSPFAPFLADYLYQQLNMTTKREVVESVHLAEIPACDESAIDAELEARMDKAQRIVSLVRAIRNKTNLRVRQPLRKVIVPVSNVRDREAIKQMESVILDEINVKSIEYVGDDSEIVHKRAKPNFKAIGPKFGKSVQAVANAIKGFTTKEIRELETRGVVTIPLNGGMVDVTRDDVEVFHEDIKGWHVEADQGLIVALDTTLTDDLINEGLAREFVNRVQNMRKDAGYEVTDRIRVHFVSDERLHQAIASMKEYVQNETLAIELSSGERKSTADKYTAEWDIDGHHCTISLERV